MYFNSIFLLYYYKTTNTDVQSLRAACVGGAVPSRSLHIFQRYSFYLRYWYQRTNTRHAQLVGVPGAILESVDSVYLLYWHNTTNADVQRLRAAGGVRVAILER